MKKILTRFALSTIIVGIVLSCGSNSEESSEAMAEEESAECASKEPDSYAYAIRHSRLTEGDAMTMIMPGDRVGVIKIDEETGANTGKQRVTYEGVTAEMNTSNLAAEGELAVVMSENPVFIYESKESRQTTSTWLNKGNVFKILKDEGQWKQIEIGDNQCNVVKSTGWIIASTGTEYSVDIKYASTAARLQGILTDSRFSEEERVAYLEDLIDLAKNNAPGLVNVINEKIQSFDVVELKVGLDTEELYYYQRTIKFRKQTDDGIELEGQHFKSLLDKLLNSKVSKYERQNWYGGVSEQANPKTAYMVNIMSYVQLGLRQYNRSGVGYDQEEGSDAQERAVFANILYNIDRSPMHIQSLFDNYKELAFSIYPKETYHSTGMNILVDELITLYDQLNRSPRKNELLDSCKAYFASLEYRVEQEEDHVYGNEYGIFYNYLLKEIYNDNGLDIEEFEYSKGGIENLDLWLPSFWYRRYVEGNAPVVYGILKDVQTRYR